MTINMFAILNKKNENESTFNDSNIKHSLQACIQMSLLYTRNGNIKSLEIYEIVLYDF